MNYLCLLRTSKTLLPIALLALTAQVASAQRPLGIDVSSYQGSGQNPPTSITWSSVPSSSIVFGWAKATEATTIIDADYVYNVTGAKSVGIAIGSYNFAHPNLDTPSSESTYFWNEVGGYTKADGLTFMPMLDMEVFSGLTGASSYTDWASQWCSNIVNAAAANSVFLKPCIYVSACNAGNFNSGIATWYSDIANYGVNGDNNPQTGTPWTACTGDEEWGSGVWAIWQYESVGTISGIKGSVDCDVVNGTTTTMQTYIATGPVGTPAPANTTLYWDPNKKHASPGSGGSGNWGTNYPNWFYTGTSNYSWTLTTATPIFAGTAGTVTLTTPVKANSLTFNTANYVVSGSYAVTLTNSPTLITLPSSSIPVTINAQLAGSSYTVTGGGSLVLNNTANSMTGTVIVSNNTTLQLGGAHALGSTPISLTLSNAAVLQNNDLTANDSFLLLGASIVLTAGTETLSDASGAILSLPGAISGSGNFVKSGFGKLFLNGTSTFVGGATISQGILAFGSTGSINHATNVSLKAGATLDVSAINNWALTTNASFQASGTGTLSGISAASVKGAAANGLSLGSQPITLVFTPTSASGDSTHPSLVVGQGILTLNSNLVTVSNAFTSPLGVGTYVLITELTNNISGAPNLTPLITGTGLAAGTVATLVVNSNQLNLIVVNASTATMVSNSAVTYGQVVTLTADILPTNATGTVQFLDNGANLGSAIPLTNGAASLVSGSLSVGYHPISAAYGGDANDAASASSVMVQEIDPAALTITASDETKAAGAELVFGAGSTNFISGGLQNGETIGSVTLTVANNGGDSNAPAGNYAITPSLATGGTFLASDYAITYLPGTLTVAGSSLPVTVNPPVVQTDGTVQLNFTGNPGSTYIIEGTTSLAPPISWSYLSTNTADTNGNFNFVDQSASNYSSRYYQTLIQQ